MIPRTPPITYRIRVWNGNAWNQGAPKETLTPENGPMSIDALNITPQGDSLDGSFTLVPAGLNIEARDSITVEIHDGGNWRPRYAGIITTAGNPRSTDRQTYRTAGIRQRMFEIINQTGWVEEGDVAAQVRSVLSNAIHRPAGMTYTAGDVPTQGFELGPRATAYETVGDFLDAMAGFVGTFAVPPGQTYTYDGHTYQAGEIVPPTRWGVRPDGSIYFRRPAPGSAAVFSEGDHRTDVEWAQINAEDATGDITLLYLGAINTEDAEFISMRKNRTPVWSTTDPTLAIPQPTARVNGRTPLEPSTAPEHATRHQLDGPLDLMEPVEAGRYSFSANPIVPGVDLTAPVDGNPNTYVAVRPAQRPPPPTIGQANTYTAFLSSDGRDKDGVWKITYALENAGGVERPVLTISLGGTNAGSSISYRLIDTEGERSTIWLPNLLPAVWDHSPRYPTNLQPQIHFSWISSDALDAQVLRIYELAYYTPDCDHHTTEAGKAGSRSARYADAHRREPAPEVARITYHGDGPQTHEIQVRPLTGGTIQAWTERITLAMTTAAGITTTYHAGQEWPAQVQEQRILLERLARRSVDAGGRRR